MAVSIFWPALDWRIPRGRPGEIVCRACFPAGHTDELPRAGRYFVRDAPTFNTSRLPATTG
jgi:hypothetical protein